MKSRIVPGDFVLIPSNQGLYFCDYDKSRILKLSRTFLTNYVGELLIVQEGGLPNSLPDELFIVNWGGTNFISREIDVSHYTSEIEDAAFAPLNLPSQPLP